MSEFALTPAERSLLAALDALGVRYLIVGMGAALLEGAPGTTQDLHLWFGRIDPVKLGETARRAGGFYTPGFGAQPPAVGGEGLERVAHSSRPWRQRSRPSRIPAPVPKSRAAESTFR